VEIKDGQLYINGSKCGRQDLDARTVRSGGREVTGRVWQESNGQATYPIFISAANESKTKDFPPLKVPEYHCFVLSDDRNLTPDSRQFGPIQVTSIVGRVDYLYWPADSWSRFGRLHN
jgi:signal peptidase I